MEQTQVMPEVQDSATAEAKFTSARDILQRMADIAGQTTEEAHAEHERLRKLYRALRDSRAAGEVDYFDPHAAEVAPYTSEERQKLFDEAKNAEELREAVLESQRLESQRKIMASPLPAYALSKQVPLIKDTEGRFTADVSSHIGQYLPGLSEPRFCLAALVAALGRPIRAERVISWLPGAKYAQDLAQEYDLPWPSSQEDWQELRYKWNDNIVLWAQNQLNQRVAQWCETRGLYPVAAQPDGLPHDNGLRKLTVLCMEQSVVDELCSYVDPETGEDAGREFVHYMQILFSNAAYVKRTRKGSGSGPEQEPEVVSYPDYRLANYLALTPDQMNAVSEFLSLGTWVSDGNGLFFPSSEKMSVKAIIERARDVEGTHMSEEEALDRRARMQELSETEFQIRATELNEVGNLTWLAKGMMRPISRKLVDQALERFYDDFIALAAEQANAPTMELKQQAASNLAAFSYRYAPARVVLEAILASPNDVCLLVKGDQIKVGAARAIGLTFGEPVHLGAAALVGTYLRGKTHMRRSMLPSDRENTLKPRMTWDTFHVLDLDQATRTTATTAFPPCPIQYQVSGNAQLIQFATNDTAPGLANFLNDQIQEVAECLTTTTGLAKLVSEEEAMMRKDLEQREFLAQLGDPDHPIKAEKREYTELDTLREALRSGLIQMTAEGVQLMSEGKPVPPGHLRMPKALFARVDALVSARVKQLLRSFGITLYGYHHSTVEDSVSLVRRLWNIERTASYRYHSEDDTEHTRTPVQYLMDNSQVVLPEVITGQMNADDDGDITQGLAAHITLKDGRVIKAVFLMRYPCVDAPIFWALPAGVPTPYDARDPKEEAVFSKFIEIFEPYIPEVCDLFGDEPVLMRCESMIRLSDQGAKSNIVKKKLSGPVNLSTCLDTVTRKRELNTTGALTRRHERLAVLINEAISKCDPEKHDYVSPIWEHALDTYLGNAERLMEILELQLTGFKYDIDRASLWPSPLHLGEDFDPFGFTSYQDVCEAIPLDYHERISRLRIGVKERYKHEANAGVVCLEHLASRPRPFSGMGKETAILNFAISGNIKKRTGGAGRQVVRNLSAIRSDLGPYLTGLKTRLKEMKVDAARPAPEIQRDVQKVMAVMQHWKSYWKAVMLYAEAIRKKAPTWEEAFRSSEEFMGHAAEAIKYKMRSVADSVSDEALTLSVLRTWHREVEAQEELLRRGYAQEGLGLERREPNAAATLALIEGRIGRIFPMGAVEVTVVKDHTHAARFFTKGQVFPGPIGGQVTFEEIYRHPGNNQLFGKVLNPKTGEHELYSLHPADGEDQQVHPPFNARLTATKQSNARVVVRW